FHFLIVDCDLGSVLVLKVFDRNVLTCFLPKRLEGQILFFQALLKVVISNTTLLLLLIDCGSDLIVSRKEFLPLGPLEKNLPLHQSTQDLKASLCEFTLRELRLLAPSLLDNRS